MKPRDAVPAVLVLLAAATAETATHVLRPEDAVWVTPAGVVKPKTTEREINGERLRVAVLPEDGAGYLSWTVREVTEGDYYLRVRPASPAQRICWYVNGVPVSFSSKTDPVRGVDEIQSTSRVRVRAGDEITGSNLEQLGEVILDTGPICRGPIDVPPTYQTQSPWLAKRFVVEAELHGPSRGPGRAVGRFSLRNVLNRPLSVRVHYRAVDYFQRRLAGQTEVVQLAPRQAVARELRFQVDGTCKAYRFHIDAEDEHGGRWGWTGSLEVDVTKGKRRSLSLNGEWDVQPADGKHLGEPPAGKWHQRVSVPNFYPKVQTPLAWFRRHFRVPECLRGVRQRFGLRFGRVTWEGHVYLNGSKVGENRDSYLPFELDVTDLLRVDQPNELVVGVRNWIAAMASEVLDQMEAPPDKPVPKTGIAPAAFLETGMAIGEVQLHARPRVHVADVFTKTFWRGKRLECDIEIANASQDDSSVGIENVVFDHDDTVLQLPSRSVRVDAGQRICLTIGRDWHDPIPWEPRRPHLYYLRTRLSDARGRVIDECLTRFGFREIWVERDRFILNGKRLKLQRLTPLYPMSPTESPRRCGLDRAFLWREMRDRLAAGADTCRGHGAAQPGFYYDIGDELGLSLIPEAARCNFPKLDDPRLWRNVKGHCQKMSRWLRNRPCILLFSAGNEVFHQGHASGYEDEGAEVVRAIEEESPLTLPYWDSGGDLRGRLDWVSLHYPAEIGVNGFRRYNNFPFFKYWRDANVTNLVGPVLKEPALVALKVGDKPIAFSEVGAYLSTHTATIFANDRVMRSLYYGSTKEAHYEYLRYYVKGVRDLEAVEMNLWPWNWNAPNIFQLPATVFPRVCVSLKEEDSRFYSGDAVVRHLNVHHDELRNETLQLSWRLMEGDEQLGGETHELPMGPCELRRTIARLKCPDVDAATPLRFVAELRQNEQVISRERRTYTVYPRPVPVARQATERVLLFDPAGKTAHAMSGLGIPFVRVPQLRPDGEASMVVVGEAVPDALDLGRLSAFVAEGGRVVVLRQDRAPTSLPVPLPLVNKDSSICYRRAYGHPLLRGLSDPDLKYWRGDHLVTRKEYAKPVRGSFRCLLDSGTLKGLDCTPLIEIYRGTGSYVLSQLRLVDKWRTEPMAAEVLIRLVSPGAVMPAPSVPELGLMVSRNSRLPDLLARLRFRCRRAAELSGLKALLAEADAISAGDIGRLRAFVQTGGTLWIRRVTPESRAVCEQILGTELELKPPVPGYADRCYRIVEHPLLSGLSNEELYWKEPHFCPGPDRGASLERIADFACRPLDPTRGVELTRPATLVAFPRGKGRVIVDQLRWDEALVSVPDLASRLVCMLFTNVGVQVNPPRDGP